MHKTKRAKLLSYFKIILWIALLQFILINISAAIYAYKFTHFYKNPTDWSIARTSNVLDKTWKLFKGPSFGKDTNEVLPRFPHQKVIIKTSDHLRLEAWHSNIDSSKGTVALFHGLTANKAQYTNEAEVFRNMGYNVLLVDFRGHGHSEGMKTSIGFHEAEEVKLAYNFLRNEGEKKIFLFGGSMGAVAITRAVSIYSLQPAGIILEMPFDKLLDHVKARGKSFGFPQNAFAYPVSFWMGIENNFPVFDHIVSDYAKEITCTVLMQYGTKDGLVQAHEIENIYKATGATNKKLVAYEGAVHSSLLQQDASKWQTEIKSFLDSY